jgi:hypothetical protein
MGMTSVIDKWGSSPSEQRASYPCDAVIDRPDRVLFRAVDVATPAEIMFHWLCQLRKAPYSYDWIDNFGRRSPQNLTEGLDQLEVGQRFVTIFRLVAFEEGRSITLDSKTGIFGRFAVTYEVRPTGDDSCRLVVKLSISAPRGPIGEFVRRVLPAGDFVMMRKQLLTLKALAERDALLLRT